MAWPAQKLLQSLDQAIDWFRARVPLTDAQAEQLQDDAKRQAFWIAGTQQLGVIKQIQASLDKAIADGQTFDAWRENIGSSLTEVVGGHAKTVYRNATQTAYNDGRRAQLSNEIVKRSRPYWMYNAIRDARTTDICSTLHGTILPADDSKWDQLLPPRHHNCRSNIRALTRSQAERMGGVNPVPQVELPKGWGKAPKGEALAEGYDRALVRVLKQKEQRALEKAS